MLLLSCDVPDCNLTHFGSYGQINSHGQQVVPYLQEALDEWEAAGGAEGRKVQNVYKVCCVVGYFTVFLGLIGTACGREDIIATETVDICVILVFLFHKEVSNHHFAHLYD